MSKLAAISDMRISESDLESTVNAAFATTCADVRNALHADLKMCGKSRERVALELSAMVGRQISAEMIDAFVAASKAHRFPAEWIPAWVTVTGSRRLLDLLCGALGLSVATEEDRDFAELGRTRLRDEKLTRKLWARC